MLYANSYQGNFDASHRYLHSSPENNRYAWLTPTRYSIKILEIVRASGSFIVRLTPFLVAVEAVDDEHAKMCVAGRSRTNGTKSGKAKFFSLSPIVFVPATDVYEGI